MSHFLPIWLLSLVLVVVYGLLLSGQSNPVMPNFSPLGASDRKTGTARRLDIADSLSVMGFLVFVIFYIFVIFYKEDFAYYDNEQLTDFSVQGKPFPPPIWPNAGRFFPLAFQEFNVLMFLTRSPGGYHSFAVAQLTILLVALFFILGDFRIRYRVPILIAAMVAPSFVVAFGDLIYPERNVLFWVVIMLLCLRGHFKTKARIYFIGCLVATHFALYYKEMVVLFVGGYVVTRLALQLNVAPRTGYHSLSELVKENALLLGMLGVSCIYAALLFAALLRHGNPSYLIEHREPLSSVLLAYLETDWLPAILLVVVILRLGRCMFFGGEGDPLWDSLAFGALAYCLCIVALRLFSGYYMAPVNLVALIYLARVSQAWLLNPTKTRVAIVAIAFACVLIHDAAYSSFRVIERKSIITARSQFADFLKGHAPATSRGVIELYFPYADGYRLMELSAYLRYKGFQLAGSSATRPAAGPVLVIEGREDFIDGLCVAYRSYACIHVDSAKPRVLTIVLPDDNVSRNSVEEISSHSVSLLSANPCAACSKPGSWLRFLHTISPRFAKSRLPEHWLQLDIFQEDFRMERELETQRLRMSFRARLEMGTVCTKLQQSWHGMLRCLAERFQLVKTECSLNGDGPTSICGNKKLGVIGRAYCL
jgi:hypothetical protein